MNDTEFRWLSRPTSLGAAQSFVQFGVWEYPGSVICGVFFATPRENKEKPTLWSLTRPGIFLETIIELYFEDDFKVFFTASIMKYYCKVLHQRKALIYIRM